MTRRHWITLACASAVLAGCGGTSTGSPQPTGPAETATETSDGGRPREIRLDGKDPCALVPRSDWSKFRIEAPGEPQTSEAFKSPQCFYGNNIGGVRLTLVMTEGVDAWTGGARDLNVEVMEAEPVEGYPTISVQSKISDRRCDALVDVADGQYLMAATQPSPSDEAQVGEKCEFSRQLAESAMKTLVES